MNKHGNTSTAGAESTAAMPEGWNEQEAERRGAGKPLYYAWACQERLRWDDGSWLAGPDGTGFIRYEEFYFVGLADAERFVRWWIAQWPAMVEDNGDVLHAQGEVDRVSFLPRDPEWPREPLGWEHHPGFQGRAYWAPIAPELEQLARQRTAVAHPQDESDATS
jgi:hypothetical protein